MQKRTTLIDRRPATAQERKDHGAEVVFTREDANARKYKIYGARCYESWEQWGAVNDVLADNVSDIEHWRYEKFRQPA